MFDAAIRPQGGASETDGVRHQTLVGLLWMVSGAGGQTILRLALVLVLARILGPETFGVAGAAVVVVNLSRVLSELGIGMFLIQRTDVTSREIRTAFTLALAMGALITGTIHLCAPLIQVFFGFDGLLEVLLVLGLTPLIANLGIVAEALARRRLAFRWLSLASLSTFVAGYGIIGIALALGGAGVWALVAAHLTQVGLWTTALLVGERHEKMLLIDRKSVLDLLRFSTGVAGWRLCGSLTRNLDNIIVGRFLGAHALGLYGRAYQMTSLPLAVLGNAVIAVMTPTLSKVKDDRRRVGIAFRDSLELMAMVTMPISVALAVLAPEIVKFILGDAWLGVIPPLQILAVGVFFRMSFRLADSFGVAMGVVSTVAWREALHAAAVVVGALIGQHFGIIGVAFGVLGALVFNFGLAMGLSMRLSGLDAGTIATAHTRALLLSALIGVTLFSLVTACRQAGLPPFVTLLAAAPVTVLTSVVSVWFRDGVLVGPQGRWLLRSIGRQLPRWMPKLV